MSHFSLNFSEGELEVNHRASPGFTVDQVYKAYGPGQEAHMFREGGVAHMPTRGCCHCGGCVIMNPKRERHRNHCQKCHAYICDLCFEETTAPDYVHRSWAEIVDMIRSGKWRFAGGSASNPILLPVIGEFYG